MCPGYTQTDIRTDGCYQVHYLPASLKLRGRERVPYFVTPHQADDKFGSAWVCICLSVHPPVCLPVLLSPVNLVWKRTVFPDSFEGPFTWFWFHLFHCRWWRLIISITDVWKLDLSCTIMVKLKIISGYQLHVSRWHHLFAALHDDIEIILYAIVVLS